MHFSSAIIKYKFNCQLIPTWTGSVTVAGAVNPGWPGLSILVFRAACLWFRIIWWVHSRVRSHGSAGNGGGRGWGGLDVGRGHFAIAAIANWTAIRRCHWSHTIRSIAAQLTQFIITKVLQAAACSIVVLLLLLLALETAEQTAKVVLHLLLSCRRRCCRCLLVPQLRIHIIRPEEEWVMRRQVVREMRMMVRSSGHHHASGHCSSRRRMIKGILLQRMLSCCCSGIRLELSHSRGHSVLMELGLDPKVIAKDLSDGELEVARRRCGRKRCWGWDLGRVRRVVGRCRGRGRQELIGHLHLRCSRNVIFNINFVLFLLVISAHWGRRRRVMLVTVWTAVVVAVLEHELVLDVEEVLLGDSGQELVWRHVRGRQGTVVWTVICFVVHGCCVQFRLWVNDVIDQHQHWGGGTRRSFGLTVMLLEVGLRRLRQSWGAVGALWATTVFQSHCDVVVLFSNQLHWICLIRNLIRIIIFIHNLLTSLNYCHYLYHLILHRNSIIFIHFTRYFPWYPFCCIKFDQHFADRCTWFVIASVVEMILSGWGRFQFRDSARMTNGRGQMSPVIWSGWHASENSKNGICCISISRATEQEWMKKKKTTAYSTTTAQTPGSYCAPVCEYIRSL